MHKSRLASKRHVGWILQNVMLNRREKRHQFDTFRPHIKGACIKSYYHNRILTEFAVKDAKLAAITLESEARRIDDFLRKCNISANYDLLSSLIHSSQKDGILESIKSPKSPGSSAHETLKTSTDENFSVAYKCASKVFGDSIEDENNQNGEIPPFCVSEAHLRRYVEHEWNRISQEIYIFKRHSIINCNAYKRILWRFDMAIRAALTSGDYRSQLLLPKLYTIRSLLAFGHRQKAAFAVSALLLDVSAAYIVNAVDLAIYSLCQRGHYNALVLAYIKHSLNIY